MIYAYLTRTGEWKQASLARVSAVVSKRLITGHGPFSGTRDGDLLFSDKPRRTAINRLRRALTEDANVSYGTYRVRDDGPDVVVAIRKLRDLEAEHRAAMVKDLRWMIDNEPSIHYSMARPIPLYTERYLPMTLDCSGSVITACRWNGFADPSGGSWSDGSTSSIAAFADEVSKAEAEPGDLVQWLAGSAHHVCALLERGNANGGNPMLFSHGTEDGPKAVRLATEAGYFGFQPTFYRVRLS